MAKICCFGSTEDGMEFPIKESISQQMICTMFDEPTDQEVYVFFNGDHLRTLSLPESYFQPTKRGTYIVAFEKNEKHIAQKLLVDDISKRLGNVRPVSDPVDVARFYHFRNTEDSYMAYPLYTAITKELLCQIFNEPLDHLVQVVYSRHVLIFFEPDQLERTFTPTEEGFYCVRFFATIDELRKYEKSETWTSAEYYNPFGGSRAPPVNLTATDAALLNDTFGGNRGFGGTGLARIGFDTISGFDLKDDEKPKPGTSASTKSKGPENTGPSQNNESETEDEMETEPKSSNKLAKARKEFLQSGSSS